MADLVRAEDLPPSTRIHHNGADVRKVDFNTWLAAKDTRDEWLCDRQVNILLDTGAAVVTDADSADPSLTP